MFPLIQTNWKCTQICKHKLRLSIMLYHTALTILLRFIFLSLSCLRSKTMRDKMATSTLELETRGLGYPAVKTLRHALTDGGRYELEFLGGPSSTYKVKKIDRREKLIGKWACISTLDRLTDLWMVRHPNPRFDLLIFAHISARLFSLSLSKRHVGLYIWQVLGTSYILLICPLIDKFHL